MTGWAWLPMAATLLLSNTAPPAGYSIGLPLVADTTPFFPPTTWEEFDAELQMLKGITSGYPSEE